MTLVGPLTWNGNYMLQQNIIHDVPEITGSFKDKAREAIENHVKEDIKNKIRKFCDENSQ